MPTRRHRILVIALLTAVSALLAGGCGTTTGSEAAAPAADRGPTSSAEPPTASTTPSESATASPPAQFFTVQQLAAAIGCEARIQGKAADFREASCVLDGSKIVFLDFDTAEGQRAWLDYAAMYGGIFLVGDRWVLTGKSKEYLESLRPTLGGAIEGKDTSAGGS